MNDTKKNILKQILKDKPTSKDLSSILNKANVIAYMHKQWDSAPDLSREERIDEDRIWTKINARRNRDISKKIILYYKIYSVAASLLLLIAVGSSFYFQSTQKETIVQTTLQSITYIASSGIQNTQKIALADGSVVHLGAGSKLTYPSEFTGENRVIDLEGQAYIDVAKDEAKPFIVRSNDLEITALGTAFEVFSNQTGDVVEAVLVNGKIKVDFISKSMKEELILLPNEKLSFSKEQNQIKIETIDAAKYTAWHKNGVLNFENEKLSMIIPRLEKWYGREITCVAATAEKQRFTFKVRDESLETILYIFSTSSPIRYKKIEENYQLYTIK